MIYWRRDSGYTVHGFGPLRDAESNEFEHRPDFRFSGGDDDDTVDFPYPDPEMGETAVLIFHTHPHARPGSHLVSVGDVNASRVHNYSQLPTVIVWTDATGPPGTGRGGVTVYGRLTPGGDQLASDVVLPPLAGGAQVPISLHAVATGSSGSTASDSERSAYADWLDTIAGALP